MLTLSHASLNRGLLESLVKSDFLLSLHQPRISCDLSSTFIILFINFIEF